VRFFLFGDDVYEPAGILSERIFVIRPRLKGAKMVSVTQLVHGDRKAEVAQYALFFVLATSVGGCKPGSVAPMPLPAGWKRLSTPSFNAKPLVISMGMPPGWGKEDPAKDPETGQTDSTQIYDVVLIHEPEGNEFSGPSVSVVTQKMGIGGDLQDLVAQKTKDFGKGTPLRNVTKPRTVRLPFGDATEVSDDNPAVVDNAPVLIHEKSYFAVMGDVWIQIVTKIPEHTGLEKDADKAVSTIDIR